MTDTVDQTRQVVLQAVRPVFVALTLAALLVDSQLALGLFLFGMIAAEFLVAALFDMAVLVGHRLMQQSSGGSVGQDAITTLRNRYAQGELTDEEFDRKLSRLREGA